MLEEMQNQGLQKDGDSPESSQSQEGNKPDPSQEETDQVTDQELGQILPDHDERGVPKENVLAEMRRKMDIMMKEVMSLKTNQILPHQYQQSQSIQNQSLQQHQNIIPKTPDEIAEMVDREAREKYEDAFKQGTVDYWELQKFQNKRTVELTRRMMSNVNSIQSERMNSETRIKDLYPDINQANTLLAQGVFQELNRRAYLMGIGSEDLYNQDPYIIENITPIIANRLGINPKIQNGGLKIQPKSNALPPNNFPGKETLKKEMIKPTQDEINLGQRFGVRPKAFVELKQKSPDPKLFEDDSGMLLS